MCSYTYFKHKSLKTEKSLCPCLLSSLCSWVLALSQSKPYWLTEAWPQWRQRGGLHTTDERLMKCSTRIHTYIYADTHTSLLKEAIVGSTQGKATKKPHWGWADKQRWPWAERDDWTDWPSDEGEELQTISRMKRKREKKRRMGRKRKMSRRPQLYWTLQDRLVDL